MTPTARTLAMLRELGYNAAVVERWNVHAKIRQDLFGCIDVLGIHPIMGMLAVQATTGSNAAKRVEKCMENENCRHWIEAGGAFEVWSWAVQGAYGKRKTWTLRRQRARIQDGAVMFQSLVA